MGERERQTDRPACVQERTQAFTEGRKLLRLKCGPKLGWRMSP